MKRPRVLSARWSRAREHGTSSLNGERGDLLYKWGDGCSKADSHLLHIVLACERQRGGVPIAFEPSFLAELHARGYDLTTLKFSVRKREPPESPTR